MLTQVRVNTSRIFRSVSQPSGIPTRMTYNSAPARTDLNIAESFNQYLLTVNLHLLWLPCAPYAIFRLSLFLNQKYMIFSPILTPPKPKELTILALWSCEGALYLYISLSIICSPSHSNSTIPSEWLIHLICPVFKSGEKSNVAQYLCYVLFQRYLRSLSMINLWIISLL